MFRLRQRLPSRQEACSLFIASAFTVNVWSIYNLLRWLPSLLPRLHISETVVVLSYIQAFALLESLLVFLVIILLGMLLPKSALRNQWVANGGVFLFISALWIILYHFFPTFLPIWSKLGNAIAALLIGTPNQTQATFLGFSAFLIAYVSSYATLMVLSFVQIRRRKAFAASVIRFIDRLLMLTLVYIALDLLGVLIVFIHLITL